MNRNKLVVLALCALAVVACNREPGTIGVEKDIDMDRVETPLSPIAPDIPTDQPTTPSLAEYAADVRSEITPENYQEQAEILEQQIQAELSAMTD